MASNISLKSISPIHTETFTNVWLDISCDDHQATSKSIIRLQSLIPSCQRFKTIEDCCGYLSISTAEKFILLIDKQFAREIVPKINHLQSIITIYIYNINRTEELVKWLKDFPKVTIAELNEIIDQIYSNQIQCQHRIRISEPLPINILNKDGQTSRAIDGGYLHFHRFIDVILKKETKISERSELIQYYRQKYQEDKVYMDKINRFEETYNKENPLKWYTDEPFIYMTLNEALRTRNIELILLFGFFIRDLNKQLQLLFDQQPKKCMKVYRGQWMSKAEVNQIQNSKNKLISINSFFSTSLNSDIASLFLDSSTSTDLNDRERILFEMEINTHLQNTKPFANISSISNFVDEEEILFMTNSIFRVQSVDKNNNQQIITIRLTLCNENEHDLKDVYAHLCKDQSAGSLTLGDVLLDMGQTLEADKYYARVLSQLQPSELSVYYNQRGISAGQLGNHQLSIEYFQIALSEMNPADISGFAEIMHNMGIAYDALDETSIALYYFNESLERYQSLTDLKYYPDTARCLNSIGSFHADQNEYEEAIENFTAALKIQREFCPHNYSDLALSYMNICNAYADLGQHSKVIEYYDQALELYKDSIPYDHPDFRQLYHNMAQTFAEMNKYSRAIVALEKLRLLYLEILPETNPQIRNIEKDIIRLKQKETQSYQ